MANFARTYTITDAAGVQTAKQAVLWLDADMDNIVADHNTKFGAVITGPVDEDDMVSNSAAKYCSQQSIVAYIAAQQAQTAKPIAAYQLLAADLIGYNTFTNDGRVGECKFTWVASLVAGHRARFVVTDGTAANYLKVVAPATKKFRYLATEGAAQGYIRSNVVGNFVDIEATADNLVIVNIGGTWLYDE